MTRKESRLKVRDVDESGNRIRVMRVIARMNIGGPAVQISGLMRGINEREFDQRLYRGTCGESEADYLEIVAKDVLSYPVNNLGRKVNFAGDLSALLNLISEIRSFKPHIVHTHTAKAGVLGRIASILSLHPSIRIHTYHGHLLNGYFGPIKRQIMILIERMLSRFTHHLLAVGTKVRQDLLKEKIGKEQNFSVMPPGLEIGELLPTELARKNLGLSEFSLQCGFIGRVTAIKRPDRFLDVVAEVKRRNIDLEFFIAGDGDLFEYCRDRIARESLPVSLLGWQTDIENVLSAADFLILTSDNEGTPLSLIQAGMAGLPVVSTNVGSISEVVVCDETGLLVNTDVYQLVDAIEKLASSVELRQKLGENAKKFTMKNFGVKRLVSNHEELYKSIL
jgi:glycosyltransferase involved in cell wall biosynthesis